MRATAVALGLLLAASASAQTLHLLDGTTLAPDHARAIADAELERDNVTGAQIALLHNGRTVWTYASDNGELAFRPLLEQLLGDTVTPWTWESYTREQVLNNQEHRLQASP